MMQSLKTNYHVKRLVRIIGNLIRTEGVVLEKDTVPAIDKAAFVQYKKQIGSRLGLQAWYLRSFGGKTHTYLNANGNGNDEHSFLQCSSCIWYRR